MTTRSGTTSTTSGGTVNTTLPAGYQTLDAVALAVGAAWLKAKGLIQTAHDLGFFEPGLEQTYDHVIIAAKNKYAAQWPLGDHDPNFVPSKLHPQYDAWRTGIGHQVGQ